MRRPLNPFKFPFLLPFCHRLMEQCSQHRFYSMESNCQAEESSITIQLLLSIPMLVPKLQLFKIELRNHEAERV